MSTPTLHLDRPEGRIAVELTGPTEGPLVVTVPGMGDLRSTWRQVVPPLAEAGYRVASTDLRGHGDSSTTFGRHGDAATGSDLLAVIDHLGGPAVLLGSSMGSAAAVWAAAQRPDRVVGLALCAPVLRNRPTPAAVQGLSRLAYRILFSRPWGAWAWAAYYRGPLHRGGPTPWLDEHVAAIRSSLRDPARPRSFRDLTLQLDHDQISGLVDQVHLPTLAFVGDLDPDYVDAAAERAWLADRLGATVIALPEVAHYPHHQAVDVVLAHLLTFLGELPRHHEGWAAPSSDAGTHVADEDLGVAGTVQDASA